MGECVEDVLKGKSIAHEVAGRQRPVSQCGGIETDAILLASGVDFDLLHREGQQFRSQILRTAPVRCRSKCRIPRTERRDSRGRRKGEFRGAGTVTRELRQTRRLSLFCVRESDS